MLSKRGVGGGGAGIAQNQAPGRETSSVSLCDPTVTISVHSQYLHVDFLMRASHAGSAVCS